MKKIRLTAKEVKKIRDAMGLSQEEFGELIDVHQTRISEWENGKYRPSPRTSKEIIRVFEEFKSKKTA